jgi:hypothetical protein
VFFFLPLGSIFLAEMEGADCQGDGAKIPRGVRADTAATREASRLTPGMRPTPNLRRYEPLHTAYRLLLRYHEGPRSGGASPLGQREVGAEDVAMAPSLRALLSARGFAAETCRLTVRGTDPEGLVEVDIESEGHSRSLRLRPGGDEVVRGFEASLQAPPSLPGVGSRPPAGLARIGV